MDRLSAGPMAQPDTGRGNSIYRGELENFRSIKPVRGTGTVTCQGMMENDKHTHDFTRKMIKRNGLSCGGTH